MVTRATPLAVAVTLFMVTPFTVTPVFAQTEDGPDSSYRDETARTLHEAAMAERERFDESVVGYTAVVRQRIGASLRMPLKDRL